MTNDEVYRRTKEQRLRDIIAGRRLQYLGHVLRMPEDRLVRRSLTWNPEGGKRKRGKPKQTLRRTIESDLKAAGLTWTAAVDVAQTRSEWRKLVARCVQGHGRT